MKIFHSSKIFPASLKKSVLALGNFDGVHLAHQKMFQLAMAQAKKHKGIAVAYTFHPHPVQVLAKPSAPPMINTLPQKLELMEKAGLDAVVIEPFDLKFAHLSAEEWFQKIVVKRLHPLQVIAGYDFTFGSHRSGTVETLEQLCTRFQIDYKILDAQMVGDALISSTQIRIFLQKGEVKLASKLLGHPYFIDGTVVSGDKRGASLGFPTANLKTANELIPSNGVYACLAQIKTRKYPAVTNVGFNPTFGGKTLTIETHLLNFKRDIYRENIRLFFIKRIRGEQTFSSAAKLIHQIKKDIQSAKKYLNRQVSLKNGMYKRNFRFRTRQRG